MLSPFTRGGTVVSSRIVDRVALGSIPICTAVLWQYRPRLLTTWPRGLPPAGPRDAVRQQSLVTGRSLQPSPGRGAGRSRPALSPRGGRPESRIAQTPAKHRGSNRKSKNKRNSGARCRGMVETRTARVRR